MWKKLALGAFALLLTAAANINLYFRPVINGCTSDVLCTPLEADRCMSAAAAAAEEISPGQAVMPSVRRRCVLSLRKPDCSKKAVTDAILSGARGISSTYGVYVNGVRLGSVADEETLRAALRGFVFNQMPTQAVTAVLSHDLEVRPEYSRSGQETDYGDMVLLITGMAPVVYLSESGEFV